MRYGTTDSDPVIALSLLCRYRLTQLGSELASRLLLVQSGEQEGAERLAERRVPPPPGAHLASPEPVMATRKRKSRKKSTSAVPESPATVESSLSTYPTSSYRSTITSPTLSTPSYSRYSSAAQRPASSSPLPDPSPPYTSSWSDTVSPTPAVNQESRNRLVNEL